MITEWTKHLRSEEEISEFQSRVRNSVDVLDRIKALLDEKESGLDRSETNINTFDQPNWAERQAFKNGYRSCLRGLRDLVNLDQQKTP